MILENIRDHISNTVDENIRLFFITRVLKTGVKMRAKILDKFDFKVYSIDINKDIRTHLLTLTQDKLERHLSRKDEITEYDVVTDDTSQVFTYSMKNKGLAFNRVFDEYLTTQSSIPKIKDLETLVMEEELWAYAVGFNYAPNDWVYSFRKITKGKVAIDERDNKKVGLDTLRTIFRVDTGALELIKGETVNLDKDLDCLYFKDTFYIIRKTKFEQIIGLEEEYKEQATEIVDDLEKSNYFEGLSLMKEKINTTPSIHKKLVRLGKLGNHNQLSPEFIKKITTVAKQFNHVVKMKEGKILIEDDLDIDIAIKMLSDYYKEGKVTGKAYGTFSGKIIES